MPQFIFNCQQCKKQFTHVTDSGCKADNRICPYCGSEDVKKEGLLNFFKGILSSGSG
jgi:putative FmdB family regulatory protein